MASPARTTWGNLHRREKVLLETTNYKSKRRVVQTISTIIVVVLPFLNILRLDIPTLRFYFFTTILWVDEFYILFLVIMLILWVIVIFSMLYGRVWCGWMCPQTVLNELHNWFTKKSRRWFKAPPAHVNTTKGRLRRGAAYGVVAGAAALISLFIGFNLVAYFVDPYRMLQDIATTSLGVVTAWSIIIISAVMFVDMMFWREKFCTKACPYAMLQSVLTDANTQIVRYHTERHDECIECKACVRDCIMGIDIRTSPYQTECIHCGDCVDSCSTVLSKLKTPLPTLITFSWGERMKSNAAWYYKLGFVDAKRWIIVGFTAVYLAVLVGVIHIRQPLSLSASGDRSTLFQVAADGRIYNEYALKITNRDLNDGWFTIGCQPTQSQSPDCTIRLAESPVFVRSREVKVLKMSIYTRGQQFKPGPNRIELVATNTERNEIRTKTEIVFFMPEPELVMHQ